MLVGLVTVWMLLCVGELKVRREAAEFVARMAEYNGLIGLLPAFLMWLYLTKGVGRIPIDCSDR